MAKSALQKINAKYKWEDATRQQGAYEKHICTTRLPELELLPLYVNMFEAGTEIKYQT